MHKAHKLDFSYPIIIDNSAQSVRDGENGAVCKFSVGRGQFLLRVLLMSRNELSDRLSNELVSCVVNAEVTSVEISASIIRSILPCCCLQHSLKGENVGEGQENVPRP